MQEDGALSSDTRLDGFALGKFALLFCLSSTGCTLISGEGDLHLKVDAGVGGSSVDAAMGGAGGGATGGNAGRTGAGGLGAGGGTGGMSSTGTGAMTAAGGVPTTPAVDAGLDSGDGGAGGTDAGPPPTCAPGTIDCGNQGCITNDVHNCGACGHDCTRLPNVSGAVTCDAGGTCTYDEGACAHGYGICSTNPDDGCVAINTKDQCGSCGTSCSTAAPVCAGSTLADGGTSYDCASGCPQGQTLCTGSCVDTKTDPLHCGSCTHACPTDPAGQATCTGGTTCGITCNAGTHLCGGKCVSDSDPNNCGTKCATSCPAPTSGGGSASCNASACALSCPVGEAACLGACLDIHGSDANNCGGCGTKCTGGKTCTGGVCGCPSGQHDCNGTCSSNTSVNSCGTSCTACAALANATAACAGGACAIGTCSVNFDDCDKKASTGCETNLLTSATNCKTCGHVCTGGTCSGGACACSGGLTNCSDTCVNLTTDASHCGTCTNVCAAGSTCQTGVCCPSGTTNCSGVCVSLQNNDNDCGGCGIKCGAGQTCSGTTCVCSGTTNCSGACVNLASDKNNCGACGHTCFQGTCDGAGTCLPWVVADTPNTSTPKHVLTDGTHVVWVDSGLSAIKQVNTDGTGVMTLSTSPAFTTLLDPYRRIAALNGGLVIVASETQGLFKANVNVPSSAAMPFTFSGLSTSSVFLFNLGINTAATHFGVMVETPTPSAQIYDCTVSALSCTAAGSAFPFAIFGAAANATNYFFPNQTGKAIQFIKFGSPPYTFQSLAQGATLNGFMAIDASSVYYMTNSTIARVPFIGGTPVDIVTSFPANTGSYYDFATDGKNVYYTAFGSPPRLAYAPVAGFADKSVKVIAAMSDGAAVAAGGGKVFWIDGSTIYGIAAP